MAVARSFKSTVKNSGARTLSGSDKKYDKKFAAKVATSKSSLSDAEDDGTVKRIRDMICQRLVFIAFNTQASFYAVYSLLLVISCSVITVFD